jgi:hypothetical protein
MPSHSSLLFACSASDRLAIHASVVFDPGVLTDALIVARSSLPVRDGCDRRKRPDNACLVVPTPSRQLFGVWFSPIPREGTRCT